MEKVNFKYSMKTIPMPSERAYLLQLMEKIDTFITRRRGKSSILATKQMLIQVKKKIWFKDIEMSKADERACSNRK